MMTSNKSNLTAFDRVMCKVIAESGLHAGSNVRRAAKAYIEREGLDIDVPK